MPKSRKPAKSRGGQGGKAPKRKRTTSPRGESGLTPSEENRLIGRALRLNFPLDVEGMCRAVETTKRNMLDEDGRTSNGAVKNWIEMVRRQDSLSTHDEQADLARQILEGVNELRGNTEAGEQGAAGGAADAGAVPPGESSAAA